MSSFPPLTVLNGLDPLPGFALAEIFPALSRFMLASLRIGSFLLAAPIFGSLSIPLQIRLILTSLLALMLLHITEIPPMHQFSQFQILAIIVIELTIGVLAGLVLSIWFAAAMLAGEKIAMASGLGYAVAIDPIAGVQTPVIAQALSMFLIVIFFGLDGHLIVLRALMLSYQFIPIGTQPAWGVLLKGGISAAGAMFLSASLIMLPIAMILLLLNLAIGVITRSAPQLNLFSFAFPVMLLAVFLLLYISVDVFAHAFSDLALSALEHLHFMLEGAIMEAGAHG